MTTSLMLVGIWAVAANLAVVVSGRDDQWGRVYALIASGVPLLGLVTWQNGPLVGLIVLAAGMSVLLWPVAPRGRWIDRLFGRAAK